MQNNIGYWNEKEKKYYLSVSKFNIRKTNMKAISFAAAPIISYLYFGNLFLLGTAALWSMGYMHYDIFQRQRGTDI